MLLSINISNYTLVEALEIDFDSGTTAITGETGAGKSILIDANLIKLNENFRVKQIWHWLYFHWVTSIDDMTSISIDLREDLKKVFILKRPKLDKEQCSTDGTRKWLIKLDDGNLV